MNKRIYPLLALLLCILSSCSSWLDITPKGQVEAKDILKDERGYNYAIGGVYYKLSGSTLWGLNMSFGAMDALSQYWDLSGAPNHDYNDFSNFKYENAKAKTIVNNYWSSFYQTITQINQILSSLEENRQSIPHAELFEGEALALRAFIHLELVKLFGPVIHTTSDLDKKAIAYRTDFDIIPLQFHSVKEVLEYAATDLKKASLLLENDPIKTVGREGDANANQLDYTNILKRRGTRMNYYATLATLVRVEMWRQNKSEAYKYAVKLIDETKGVIELTSKEDFGATNTELRDIICEREFLFALYHDQLYDITGPLFSLSDYVAAKADNVITISESQYSEILNYVYGRTPDGAGTDLRLRNWFAARKDANNKQYYVFQKLKKPIASNTIPPVPYWPEIPVIKMSEMYYTACECQIGVDNALALNYLNSVRTQRGLPEMEGPLDDDVLEEYLVREMRKDFFGEGVMFGFYKRRFKTIDVYSTRTIQPLESNFVLPIPDEEYEFSDNEKPAKK